MVYRLATAPIGPFVNHLPSTNLVLRFALDVDALRLKSSNPLRAARRLHQLFLCVQLLSDSLVVFEGYAGRAVRRPIAVRPESGLSGPIFSGPHDFANSVRNSQASESSSLSKRST